jgi:hypothetical protein
LARAQLTAVIVSGDRDLFTLALPHVGVVTPRVLFLDAPEAE